MLIARFRRAPAPLAKHARGGLLREPLTPVVAVGRKYCGVPSQGQCQARAAAIGNDSWRAGSSSRPSQRVGHRTIRGTPLQSPRALRGAAAAATANAADDEAPRVLVLVRHGESEWNKAGLFTGWHDPDLSDKGVEEAASAGRMLKQEGLHFDVAYTSVLQRAIKTCWSVLTELDLCWIPVRNSWRLNERMYGGLTGMDKKKSVEEYGMDQIKEWRRSFDIPPPPVDEQSEYYPGNDPKYANVDPADLPKSECLKDTIARCMPFWEGDVAPSLRRGDRVLVAAHGNTIRAICKYLDNITDEDVCGLEIPTGVPLVYTLDKHLKPIPHPDAAPMLSGRFLADAETLRKAQEAVAAQIAQSAQ